MSPTLPFGLAAGALAGAVFGVLFGAGASLFEGGPPAVVGILESWWWFAIVGAAIGAGTARAYAGDLRARA